MNVFNIARSFEMKKKFGWPKLYFAIDLHDVLIIGRHNKFNEGRELCPNALEVMRWIKNRADMCWILYSCSHKEPTADMVKWLDSFGIAPDYINENPECPNGHLCDFSRKFYFDIMLEDKAGFDASKDWQLIIDELKLIKEWDNMGPTPAEVDKAMGKSKSADTSFDDGESWPPSTVEGAVKVADAMMGALPNLYVPRNSFDANGSFIEE